MQLAYRHCSHSSDHGSWTSILRSGFTIHFSVRYQVVCNVKGQNMVQSKQLRALLQTVKQSISTMMVKHCKTGTAACSPKSRLISPIMVQASCTPSSLRTYNRTKAWVQELQVKAYCHTDKQEIWLLTAFNKKFPRTPIFKPSPVSTYHSKPTGMLFLTL